MRTLSLHLARRAGLAALGAVAGFALVAWALQVVRVAPEVLTDATPAGLAWEVVLLPLVPILSFVLPAAFAAGIFVAGRGLAAEGAWDALAAGGVSPRRTLQPFLGLLVGAALLSAALSLIAEPLVLARLRTAAPELAATTFAGRVAPGSFAPAGPGTEVYAGSRDGDRYRNALVVRRERGGGTTEVAAGELRLAAGGPEGLVLELRDGSLRVAGADGVVTAGFGSLRLPLDVVALQARIEAMLPAGLGAPPAAIVDPTALAAASARDRYLMLRRWAAPLGTLFFGLLAAALAVRGTRALPGALLLVGALGVTHAVLRLLEPAASDGRLGGWAAVLIPHAPAALLAFGALARLYLPKPVWYPATGRKPTGRGTEDPDDDMPSLWTNPRPG
jgi:lipopolysaccharide export LptBFGC system permease protein LptF